MERRRSGRGVVVVCFAVAAGAALAACSSDPFDDDCTVTSTCESGEETAGGDGSVEGGDATVRDATARDATVRDASVDDAKLADAGDASVDAPDEGSADADDDSDAADDVVSEEAAALLENGAPCAGPEMCASGSCADDRCCDSACDGTCERCDLPGSEGACAAVGEGADPDFECLGTGAAGGPCIGTCDGAGACKFPPNTQSCGGAQCSASVELDPLCDGKGACIPNQKSCGAYACNGHVCGTGCAGSDSNCATNAYCAAGKCELKKDNGKACGADNQCTSGHCVGGTCCGSSCAAPSSCESGTCQCAGATCGVGQVCTVWYLDQDDDGYPASSNYNKTGCSGQKPAAVNGHNYYDSTKTTLDCYDENKNARPGQTAYFTVNRGDGKFDYDCDGVDAKYYANLNGLTCGCNQCTNPGVSVPMFGSCSGVRYTEGYYGNMGCGESATLQRCTSTVFPPGCSKELETAPNTPQPCH